MYLYTIAMINALLFGGRDTPGAVIGLLAGIGGVFYGLWSEQFTARGFYGFTSKEAEQVVPRWYHRALVVSVSAIVAIGSLKVLLHSR